MLHVTRRSCLRGGGVAVAETTAGMMKQLLAVWICGLVIVSFLSGECGGETVAECGGQLTQEAGQILSPGYPTGYPNSKTCSWVITVQPGKVVDFTFLSLELEGTSRICADYVVLHAGPSRQDAIISGDLCLPSSNKHYRSPGNQMLVYFYSDWSISKPGFSASYKTLDCQPFMYGTDICDTACTCKQENTFYCDSRNGSCICKPGWTSSDCSVDINECLSSQTCQDPYSNCVNSQGGYDCFCKSGLVLDSAGNCKDEGQCQAKTCSHACVVDNSTETCICPKGFRLSHADNLTCQECEDWKYGDDCKFDCKCDKSRTESCDKVIGLCSCYLNWTSTDCSQNVNECYLEHPPCDLSHSYCQDTWGSFECQCFQGYELVTNETTCEECGRTLTNATGTITSPRYYYVSTYTYSNLSSTCSWTIKVNESSVISFKFLSLGSTDVEIYDGDSPRSRLITSSGYGGRLYRPSNVIRSTSNHMHIVRRTAYYSGSFTAVYWSHECHKFMWGDNCTVPCKCVDNNTEYCDSTSGRCVCKRAWTSDDCSMDVDECFSDPLACPDYSDCHNIHGSYNCKCKDGFVSSTTGCILDQQKSYCAQANCSQVCVNATGPGPDKCYCPVGMMLKAGQCDACKNMTYGPGCSRPCQCVENNTLSCHPQSGTCHCLDTWTGPTCALDVDECYLMSDRCDRQSSTCSNTQGGYRCDCKEDYGYERSENGNCVKIDCTHSLVKTSGYLFSPNFPNKYFNTANCSWSISVTDGDVVSFRFSFLDVEYYFQKCDHDYVNIYDGNNTKARLIGQYCDTFPKVIRSTGSSMLIEFISDYYNARQGFNATYTSHACPRFMYGDEFCDNNCSCDEEHTQFCDSTNGACICRSGWMGENCATDLNECQDTRSNICPSNSDCVNTDGSFICQCHRGFAMNESASYCMYSPQCERLKCSHTCYTMSSGEERCACPEGLVLDQAEGLMCVVPYYPYGPSSNDEQISLGDSSQDTSRQVQFGSGVPFGANVQVTANVHISGLVSFGEGQGTITGTPNLKVALDIKLDVVAAYWANTNPSRGKVFYKLYEKCEPSLYGDSKVGMLSPNKTDVMKRVGEDIAAFYNLPGFEVNSALVVTWEKVQPFSLSSEAQEENTFQAIVVTGWTKEDRNGEIVLHDEVTSYVIFLYQHGMMNWSYVPGRAVSIGTTGSGYQGPGDTDTSMVASLGKVLGNTGLNGVWTYPVGSLAGPEQKCHKYVCSHSNLISDPVYQAELSHLYKCPCTLERLGQQWQLYEIRGDDGDIYCYAISAMAKRRLLQGNRRNKLCCYRRKKPCTGDWREWERTWRESSYLPTSAASGHVLINDLWSVDPFDNFQALENIQAHQWCCNNTDRPELCTRFYKIFPDMGCSNVVEFVSASALGDPHITTLDGRTYTMNGWGEYVLMEVPSENFTLQARTSRAETANGSLTNATVFTAFAASESNYSHFQVELAWSNTTMVIIANGMDLTKDFYDNPDFTFSSEHIIVARECKHNRTDVIATLPAGVTMRVHVGVKSLEIELEVDKHMQNKTRGLLGNFNGDVSDEFQLRDGSILAANLSERDIYYLFAKQWSVDETISVFVYDDLETAATFQHPDFVPMFIDEANQSEVAFARVVCGDTNDACIFDYLVTRDQVFAANTGEGKQLHDNFVHSLDNNLPTLAINNKTLNRGRWMVTHGEESVIQIFTSDADHDSVFLNVVGNVGGVTVYQNGTITFTADFTTAITLGVQGVDSKGGYSSIMFIPISVCSGCSGHGRCDETRAASQGMEYDNNYYQILPCVCEPAYTGRNCESELNGCAVFPCSVGQNCTDLTAQQQGNSPQGYICGPCPQGFSDFDGKCADVNECSNTNSRVCDQICINTEGSYQCACSEGYRMDVVSRTCVDIDECEERTAKCQQDCVNIDGSYNCSCTADYVLNTDGVTCKLASPFASECQKCEQVCTVKQGQATCSCHVGYVTDPYNHSKCIDYDECKAGNSPCSQVCTNTVGWFICGCYLGYKLQADGVSCAVCERPYYGENCESTCNCLGRGTCNPVRGCDCVDQWAGANCELDANECDSPKACPAGQVCRNEVGTFTCLCPDGYQKVNGVCIDINECSGPQAVLQCNSTEVCVNTEGSYRCDCKSGYSRTDSSHQCQDIDECERGTAGCEQICENMPGLYNCRCYPGYKLAEDRRTCRKDRDYCSQVLNCSYGCSISLENRVPFCYCPRGYSLLNNSNTCIDIDECSDDTLNQCTYKDGCMNTNGSFMCSCPSGFKLDNDGRSCVGCRGATWGLECANSCACGIGADHCDSQTGCVCKPGFTGRWCTEDIDECENGQVRCRQREKCVNLPGTALCTCLDGYENIMGVCVDMDECGNSTSNNCSQLCTNLEGGFVCSCYPGYIYDPALNTCSDIDECQLPISHCQQGCINTQGSYRCTCKQGMQVQADGLNCSAKLLCSTNNSCSDTCAVIAGVDTCLCPRGRMLGSDNFTCLDIDLCAGNKCQYGCRETHANTSFECLCDPGKQLDADGVTCIDCSSMKWGPGCANNCSCVAPNMRECNKVSGSCACSPGWTGPNCEVDVDECSIPGLMCPEHSDCNNTEGGFVCACRDGYMKRSGGSGLCEECEENFYGPSCYTRCQCSTNFVCDKVDGSCHCPPTWTGVNCDVDVDECAAGKHTCDTQGHELCQNTVGGYLCVCVTGSWRRCGNCSCDICEDWTFGLDCGQSCQCQTNTSISCDKINGMCTCDSGWAGTDCSQDVDECTEGAPPCPDHSDCVNEPGTYRCECNIGYTHYQNHNTTCTECEEWKYGEFCLLECPCNRNTSNSCTNTDGVCECKPGWTGASCSEAECGSDICPPHSDCVIQDQEHPCTCHEGYMWEVASSTCLEQAEISLQLTLDFNVSTVDLNNKNSSEFIMLRDQVQQQMSLKLSLDMKVQVSVVVTKLSKGSLIVDVQVLVPKDKVTNPKTEVANAVLRMMDMGGVQLNNQSVSVISVDVDNNKFAATDSKCDRKEKLDPCDADSVCDEQENEAVCKKHQEEDDLKLGLGLGLSLFVVLCVVVAGGTFYWTRKQEIKHKKKDMGVATDSVELQHMATRSRNGPPDTYNPFSLPTQEIMDRHSSLHSQQGWSHDQMLDSSNSYINVPRIPRVQKILP